MIILISLYPNNTTGGQKMYNNAEYKDVRKKLIHPWEKPMRFVNIIIFFIVIIGAIAVLFTVDISQMNKDFNVSNSTSIAVFSALVALIYTLGISYAKTKATSVKLSENQFPEIYDIVKKYSNKIEMGYIPEAYVVQKGGVLNAFATSFFSKRYISINSDIFDVCYLEHKDVDTLSFIIAHELAHLRRKHATTLMTIVETPSRLIPIWSSTISRVKEYTSDRYAAWLCPEGIDGVIMLSVGKHIYKNVNVDEYVINSNKRYKGLFCWIYNLTSSHPVLPKRMKALKNLDKRGKVF